MTIIDFIRHGEPDTTVHDDQQRPLTALGLQQAIALAHRMHNVTYDAVYASPLKRAVATITPLATDHGLVPILDERLVERKMPQWLADFPNYVRQQWSDLNFADVGGESIAQTRSRLMSFLATLPESAHVAIASHGTVMSSLVEQFWPGHGFSFFKTLDYAEGMRLIIEHGMMTTLIVPKPFSVLGCDVNITIDRPLGSRHPRFPQLQYPVNYGYDGQQIGGDGQPQDVYVLGVDEPMIDWHGQIQAIIHRTNDAEDKWIGAASNVTVAQVRQATQFQERYFDSRMIVLTEHAN